jgi:hypothetical protein
VGEQQGDDNQFHVVPGSYRIRLDEVESNSGTVHARADVPFTVPDMCFGSEY